MDDAELLRTAEMLDDDLRMIRRVLVRTFEADKERISLTPPQLHAMAILTRPSSAKGLTVTELRAQMGLSQSTISGIVARLERRGFVHRSADAADRRATRIAVTEEVKMYMHQVAATQRLGPLVRALAHASAAERQRIMSGIGTLRGLLTNENAREGG
jgi:MarR family transcriptional regulator, organic hydroperoxide resistance regulator